MNDYSQVIHNNVVTLTYIYFFLYISAVLVLYLSSALNFSNDDSTLIYHSFISLSYLMPLFGAILSDSYWGKYK